MGTSLDPAKLDNQGLTLRSSPDGVLPTTTSQNALQGLSTTTPATITATGLTLPLTTPIEVPGSCVRTVTPCGHSDQPLGGQTWCPGFFDSSCYPSSYFAGATYSPGICPSRFTIAAAATSGNDPATTAVCCPSGYTYNGVQSSKYGSDLSAPHPCFSAATATTSFPISGQRSSATLAPNDILAMSSVVVKWEARDTVIVEQLGGSSMNVINSLIAQNGQGVLGGAAVGNDKPSTASASPIGTSSITSSNATSKSGSNNLAVKVAVPIAVVAAALLVVLFFLLFRKHRRAKQVDAFGTDPSGLDSPGLEYPIPSAMAARSAPPPPTLSTRQDPYAPGHRPLSSYMPPPPLPALTTNVPREAVAGQRGEDSDVSPISSHRPSFERAPAGAVARGHTPPHGSGAGPEPISPVESAHSHSLR